MRHTTKAALEQPRFPVLALLCLAATGFLAIMTETLPAGLLPQVGASLRVSNAVAGQLVSVYAAGSLIAAIPLTTATRSWKRRRLLSMCLIGLLLANVFTAVSPSFVLTLGTRFLAGTCAGLIWGILPGYAQQMVEKDHQGRAVAFAMAGTPIAFSLGVPLGTSLAHLVGWRSTFGVLSGLSALVILYAAVRLPEFQGVHGVNTTSLSRVLRAPGVGVVLAVVFLWMAAHNALYTYIVPLVEPAGLDAHISALLFVFGLSALVGIVVTGVFVDRALRTMTLTSLLLFALVSIGFGLARSSALAIWGLCAVWGITFGGAATLLQTACMKAAGEGADLTPSMVTTSWNLAIAAGGLLGGGLLRYSSAGSIAWVCAAFVLGGFGLAINRAAFPTQNNL